MKVPNSRVSAQNPEVQNTPNQPEIVCPVIRGMVNEGHLQVDAKGNAKISELKDIFEDLGFNRHLAHVAVAGNGIGDIAGNLFGGKFNVNQLRGGLLDHSGDSMILRNGKFDPERFNALIAHSSDGVRMTADDFAKAIKDNKQIDNASWIGSKISGVEFSILMDAFGTKGADGVKGISIEDLRNLYEHKQIPPSFRPTESVRPENNVASMASQMRDLASGSQVGIAKAGVNSALQSADLFTPANLAVQGAGKGVCPHMSAGGAQTTSAPTPEITQLHNQLSAK